MAKMMGNAAWLKVGRCCRWCGGGWGYRGRRMTQRARERRAWHREVDSR